jgi:hypothetical protein
MTTPNAIALVRARLSCQLEAAAREVEQALTDDAPIRAAYDQGRADERQDMVARLMCWHESIPPTAGRHAALLRSTLHDIIRSVTT